MDDLELLGNKAYQKGLWGNYKGAVAILSKAIERYPFDKRLYNDRSFYYYKLKNYTNALHDAEFMLKLCPTYTRAHFRKGEVLVDLKKYEEAESVFRDILKLEPNNKEANFYLLESQINQLTKDTTYWVQDAKRALHINNYNTEQARSFLELEDNRISFNNYDNSDIYYSDEEVEQDSPTFRGNSVSCRKPNYCQGGGDRTSEDGEYDPLMDPSNPFQSNALWVGNITNKVTERNLEPIFSKYGRIKSIFVQHNNSCAFINYAHPSMASNAMRKFPKKLQLEDTNLVIRFPDSAKTKTIPNYSSKSPKRK